ncbi:MAG: DNA mismatch repair protein MutS [Selenomonas sp.]|nr:DNA mismatch repair protein MutS [Selenomonas sp.]
MHNTYKQKASFYANLQHTALSRAQDCQKKSSRLTLERTICFFALLFSLAGAYDGLTAGLLLSSIFLITFILLIRRHNRVKKILRLLDNEIAVLRDYLCRFDNSWQQLPVNGQEFSDKERPQNVDLHIFGPSSLFQYLCAARTKGGRLALSHALAPVPPVREVLLRRQSAVRELLGHPYLCVELEALGRLLPDNHDTTALVQEITADRQRHISRTLQRTAWILPVLTASSIALAGLQLTGWDIPGLLILLQFTIAMIFHKHNQAMLAPLHALQQELHTYQTLFIRMGETNFTSPALTNITHSLSQGAAPALQTLARLTDHVNLCRNLFFFVCGNALLLWDCHCAARFCRWQLHTAQHLKSWLASWSEMELYLSLAMAGHTRECYTFPQLLDGAPRLNATALTSLLLNEDQAVPNDTAMQAETRIITGSNMSGKTTYMRTLASSLVLAYAGAPVCARSFAFTPMHIFTSIQVHDDQSQGISTFYAELLRIKQMVDFCKQQQPMLICIDEIFKGTNSADRIIGAREAIARLTQPYCLTLVSTHDFELCDIESPNSTPVTNFHFAEYYEDNKIKFDYKIKNGRCQTTNAQYLLKMAGIM